MTTPDLDRFKIVERPTAGRPAGKDRYVRIVDTYRFGKVASPAESAVLSIDTSVIPLATARDLARQAMRSLARQQLAGVEHPLP